MLRCGWRWMCLAMPLLYNHQVQNRMTPTLTPTPWDRAEQNRMLPRPKARKIQGWCTQWDTAERPEAVFKFAKRVDRMKADPRIRILYHVKERLHSGHAEINEIAFDLLTFLFEL